MGRTQVIDWFRRFIEGRKKGRQVRSKIKVMLLAFFDSEGIVHHEYAPDGQTINKEFYLEVLRRLREQSCAPVFDQKRHRSVTTAAMLTRSRTVRLFPIPKA